jgi:hypothetical protein
MSCSPMIPATRVTAQCTMIADPALQHKVLLKFYPLELLQKHFRLDVHITIVTYSKFVKIPRHLRKIIYKHYV